MSRNLWNSIKDWQLIHQFGIGNRLVLHKKNNRNKKWIPPRRGEIKISCDGEARGNPGPAGIGVCLRYMEGKFQLGLCGSIGVASNFMQRLLQLLEVSTWHCRKVMRRYGSPLTPKQPS